MPNDKIIKYYLLSTIRVGTKKHLINELPADKISAVFTQRELNLYLRKREGYYIAREIIVGGADAEQARERKPIIMIY